MEPKGLLRATYTWRTYHTTHCILKHANIKHALISLGLIVTASPPKKNPGKKSVPIEQSVWASHINLSLCVSALQVNRNMPMDKSQTRRLLHVNTSTIAIVASSCFLSSSGSLALAFLFPPPPPSFASLASLPSFLASNV